MVTHGPSLTSGLRKVAWSEGTWLNAPPDYREEGKDLVVATAGGSDFWRHTAYGFVRDDGHALLADLPDTAAVEVTFTAEFLTRYDQAGLMVRVHDALWVKAGVELTDGAPHVGAVVTRRLSDWSLAPVPDWSGRPVTVRASRFGGALVIRARCDGGPWRLLRVAPWPAGVASMAGPYCCSPGRSGLLVRFGGFFVGPADSGLHVTP
ncbi:DUF1349 domain-containing protein [Streptomyces herbicida]|uniref:DUF1349 domain-containing protein n=1 Tax=Streptomyces herbicida TaxID=3065675 RepID=UPI00292F61B9|nr:DUF1349 domain-containing protein [Streptomyces sp. NEAU-HV9]